MDKKIFNYCLDDDFGFSQAIIKGEKKYYVEGYCSTIDEDKAGEILDHSAQQDIYNQIQNENITLDLEHSEWYGDNGKLLQRPKNSQIPVAKIVSAELRPRGVWVKAELNQNLSKFQEVWGSIKDGFLKAFSVAFYPIQKAGGVIKHLNLVNITLTGSPVNNQATFAVSMKSAAAWLDSQEVEVKAGLKPKIDNPADTPEMPGIENKPDTYPVKKPTMTELKSEEDKMKCSKCDKEFESKEALDKHLEEVHGKEEKPETKSVEESKETPAQEAAESKSCHGGLSTVKAEEVKAEPVIDVKAEVQKMKDAHDAELKALHLEVENLKAELAKPVMKATVEAVMPKEQPEARIVSPLQLLR